MKTDKRNIIFMIVEAIFIFALMLQNGKVFKVYESVILGLLLLGSSSYYLYYMMKKITHVPYKLYPVKRTLEKNQLLVPRFMGSFFDIL